MLDSKLNFYRHVNYLHSQALKLLRLIRFITYKFLSSDSIKVLYIILILSKFEHASVVCHELTSVDSNKLENIQRKFAGLCYWFMVPITSLVCYQYCFIIYYLIFNLVLVLVLVYLYLSMHSMLACYWPLVVGNHLNKEIELNCHYYYAE
jgi:hypothetical protein